MPNDKLKTYGPYIFLVTVPLPSGKTYSVYCLGPNDIIAKERVLEFLQLPSEMAAECHAALTNALDQEYQRTVADSHQAWREQRGEK
jgi:hypothetical protein